MDWDKILTLVVLLSALTLFVKEWIPLGLTAILAPLLLVFRGILEPRELWDRLADNSVIAVAAMFMISGALSQTEALQFVGDSFMAQARRGKRRVLLIMMVVVAALSAFVNNTTIVLVFLPIILRLCDRIEQPPSRFLIPLSFASIFGGMATLIGTSTNVVVSEVGVVAAHEAGLESAALTMWDFTPVGSIFVVAGILYMITIGHRLIPDRVALSMALGRGKVTEYVTEAEIVKGSSWVGRPLGDISEKIPGLRILQLIRGDVIRIPAADALLEEGDLLLVKGGPDQIVALGERDQARLLPDADAPSEVRTRRVDLTLGEVIVPPKSRWVGRPVSAIGIRARYGVSVIALQRQGHHVRQKVGELIVEPADMLLVQGTPEDLRNLRASDNMLLLESEVERTVVPRRKAPMALMGLGIFVGMVVGGWDPATAAISGALFTILFRCHTLPEAFATLDWNVLLTLGGALALGQAVQKVGLAQEAAAELVHVSSIGGPWLLLAVVYIVTTILTDTITNGSAAALMIPVVVAIAKECGLHVEPFLLAVAFAASAAFLSPVGYQTNLIVYNPGGYRFRDFLRVGLPLRILFWILAVIFIPIFHPF